MAQEPLVGQSLPHYRGFTIALSVGLLWTNDQPDAETSTFEHTTFTIDIHAPGGIRTHNPSKWAAADPRLMHRGHLNRLAWPKSWQSIITGGILSIFKQVVPKLIRRRVKTCCSCLFPVSCFCRIIGQSIANQSTHRNDKHARFIFRVGPYLEELLISHLFFCNLLCFKASVYNLFPIYSIGNSIIMFVVSHSVYKCNAATVYRANVNY